MALVSSSSPVFSVRRREAELVAPARPTPRELKLLSDIDDQEGLRMQIPVIMFYRNDPLLMEGRDPAMVIREAVAAALVFYYPFAGRLVEGPNRKLAVDCTGEGVVFTEADADVTVEDLGDAVAPPCPNLPELLFNVPGSDGILGCPLLLIQVTRLMCGGFIFAIRFNHTMCDGPGLVQFLNAVGEMARGGDVPSPLPGWQRDIFNARDPLDVTCMHHEYEEAYTGPPKNTGSKKMAQRPFFFGPKQIQALKGQLPPHLQGSTTFEVVTACLWKCRTSALALRPDETIRISFAINARGKHVVPLPSGFYGNAFVYPAQVSKAQSLCEGSLGFAVEMVKKVKAQMSEEYMRSVADFMVMKGRPLYKAEGTYIISDTTRVGFGEVDFGWGKPVHAGIAAGYYIYTFLVRFRNSTGEEGIVVPVRLPSQAMERFEGEIKKMIEEPIKDLSNVIKDA
ncbi:methanol O-anthraniloyltransferase-like [Malania oleifera]|uniref:methanol O-anthraniloyltransferase-like n=1 Tax=Malania oleifera TaxID=397392 RepID=UPI0025AE2EB2|nr:methanol O-anthraniloyltransferase-like [Malania oleifera]